MKIFSEFKGGVSEKNFVLTLVLAIFLGVIGVHRFYVGKVWTGVMFFFTAGFFGVGVFLDVVMIVFQQFTDKNGDRIRA